MLGVTSGSVASPRICCQRHSTGQNDSSRLRRCIRRRKSRPRRANRREGDDCHADELYALGLEHKSTRTPHSGTARAKCLGNCTMRQAERCDDAHGLRRGCWWVSRPRGSIVLPEYLTTSLYQGAGRSVQRSLPELARELQARPGRHGARGIRPMLKPPHACTGEACSARETGRGNLGTAMLASI
jgi:hypothetical protein